MYCSISDVRSRNTLILTDEGVSDSIITGAIEYAQSIVNGMLVLRHPVPFSPVPVIIREITADLAAARCLASAVGSTGGNEDPKQAKDLRDGAYTLLKEIVKSSLFPVDSGETAPASFQVGLKSTSYNTGRVFEKWDPSISPGERSNYD